MITLQDFFLDSWKDAFLFLLKEMRLKYQAHLFVNKKSTTKYNYSGISKQERMSRAFEEVIVSILVS